MARLVQALTPPVPRGCAGDDTHVTGRSPVSDRVNRTAAIGADPAGGPASIPDQRRAPPTSNGGLPAEDRVFPPSPRFAADANLSGRPIRASGQDPEGFWAERDVMGRAACDGPTWARSSTGARHTLQVFPAEPPLFAV